MLSHQTHKLVWESWDNLSFYILQDNVDIFLIFLVSTCLQRNIENFPKLVREIGYKMDMVLVYGPCTINLGWQTGSGELGQNFGEPDTSEKSQVEDVGLDSTIVLLQPWLWTWLWWWTSWFQWPIVTFLKENGSATAGAKQLNFDRSYFKLSAWLLIVITESAQWAKIWK